MNADYINVGDYLQHYGVKNMRWGFRKKRQTKGRKRSGSNKSMSKRQRYIQEQLKINDETLEERKARIRASQINVGKSYLKKNAVAFSTIPAVSVATASVTGTGALGVLGAGAVGVSLAALGGAYKIAKNTKNVYYKGYSKWR